MVETQIVNVVATASLNQELDFYELRQYKEIFHDSDVYGGRVAYLKTKNMEGRVSLFPSGKMISVGTRSEKKAFEELNCAMRFLVEKGFIKKVTLSPRTQNIVVTVDFERRVNLEELVANTRGIYKPKQFPAFILKVEKPYTASILIFASGKVIIAGLKSSEQIVPVIQKIEDILKALKNLSHES